MAAVAMPDGPAAAAANGAGDDDNELVLPDIQNVIVPPPDLRPIIEKTAAYVAKHGTAFEAVILSKQQNDRRFDFLHPDNPYHAYYKSKLVHLLLPEEEQKRLAAEAAQAAEREAAEAAALEQQREQQRREATQAAPKKALTFSERLKLDIARSNQANIIPTSSAPEELCIPRLPYEMSQLDLDIVRLAGRYVASQGKTFLNALLTREARNAQFDFLRPSHPCYALFQGMVEAYESIMDAEKRASRLAKAEAELNDPSIVQEEILGRIEYERIQERLSGEREMEDEAERVAIGSIDWHDFVVLRTVDFTEDENTFLPAPFHTIEEINRALDAQDRLAANQASAMERDTEMDMEMEPIDDDTRASAGRPAAEKQADRAIQFQKCPNCSELVRATELSEHVRICLLDPRWKDQKQASAQKHRDSNLLSGREISEHLSELARRRQDIFTTKPAEPEPAVEQFQQQRQQQQQQQQQAPPVQDQHSAQAPAVPSAAPPQPWGWDHQASMMAAPMGYPMPPQGMHGYPPAPPPQFAAPPGFPPMPMHVPPPMPPHMMPPMPMMPPPGQMHPPGPMPPHPRPAGAPGAPPAKKARGPEAMSADEFARANPGPVSLTVQLPKADDPNEWNLSGQTVPLSLPVLSTTLQVKQALSERLKGLAANKMKLQLPDGRWLKDSESLAFYNVRSNTTLTFELKERGRKK
ncbi:SURP motif domain-containing protein [Plasmodiophora brassicae]